MESSKRRRAVVVPLLETRLISGSSAVTAMAQNAPPAAAPAPVPAVAPAGTIRAISVTGQQRLEPDTVLSYTKLRIGQSFTQESLDQAQIGRATCRGRGCQDV